MFQFFLSLARVSIVRSEDGSLMLMLILVRSFCIVRIHDVGGRPFLFLVGVKHSRSACLIGVSQCRRKMCPRKVKRLLLITELHFSAFVIMYSLLLETFLGHLIPRALRSNRLWNASNSLLSVSVNPHSSEL